MDAAISEKQSLDSSRAVPHLPRCPGCRAASPGRSAQGRIGAGGARRPARRRPARPAPVRRPRLCLARHLRRRAAADADLGGEPGRRGQAQRTRDPDAAMRLWRVPRPDRRRHPDDPGGMGAPARHGRRRRRPARLLDTGGRHADQERQYRRRAHAHRPTHRRQQLSASSASTRPSRWSATSSAASARRR